MPEKVVTLASTTSSQAELEHAASDSWRTPYVPPKEEIKATEPPATEGKSAAESETASTEQKLERKPGESHNGWQKRIDRLTARNKSIEAENAELRARLESRQAEQQPKPAAPVSITQDGPKIADFATAEEWADARSEWRASQQRQQEEQSATAEESRQVWESHNARLSEARAKYEDFDDVAQTVGNINIPNSAALAIIEQPNSADVTYYLATHLEEANKLADLRPMQQIAAIARISDKLSATPAPKPKPVSQAPQPIKPVGGAPTGSTVNLGDMSYQDYKRARATGRA